MKVLVTGANGFIGRALCGEFKERGEHVFEWVGADDIGPATDWTQALKGVEVVIHLAARVHIVNDPAVNPIDVFRKVNVLGTEQLARMAARAGVKRFIFISSVKVNGEGANLPYTEKDAPQPQDAYSISKREAEDALACLAAQIGLQTVILRPPLVYGPGVKANFKNLIKIVGAGLPLPFKGIQNSRSFIYLGNLVDAIITCVTHPLAPGETFLVSDGQDVSTPDLIKMIAFAMNSSKSDSHKRRDSHFCPSHLFYLHPGILKALCRITGKAEELEKLTGTLLVDSSKIRNLLGWKPPFTLEEGIKETVKGIW